MSLTQWPTTPLSSVVKVAHQLITVPKKKCNSSTVWLVWVAIDMKRMACDMSLIAHLSCKPMVRMAYYNVSNRLEYWKLATLGKRILPFLTENEEQRKILLISQDSSEENSFVPIFSIFFIKETIISNFYSMYFFFFFFFWYNRYFWQYWSLLWI